VGGEVLIAVSDWFDSLLIFFIILPYFSFEEQ
jgi:hypothetical protein